MSDTIPADLERTAKHLTEWAAGGLEQVARDIREAATGGFTADEEPLDVGFMLNEIDFRKDQLLHAIHVTRCEQAGCNHPAIYPMSGEADVEGYCKLCRLEHVRRGDWPSTTEADVEALERKMNELKAQNY